MSSIRRLVPGLAVILAGCASLPGAAPDRRTAVTRGELSEQESVAHVLSRLTFGARPGDADRVRAVGIAKWIEQQLQPHTIPDSALSVAMAPMKSWNVPIADISSALASTGPAGLFRPAVTVTAPATAGAGTAAAAMRLDSVKTRVANLLVNRPGQANPFFAGKIVRAQVSERQLEEVMADFWENHFSVFANKVPSTDAIPVFDRGAIRPRVFGRFRELLGAVAHSPAMLHYLDNTLSRAGATNENYARELMELHTLGVEGGYTQQDVIDVARALTGWTLTGGTPSPTGGSAIRTFFFNPALHDTDPKRVLGQVLPAGRGIEDGEQVLDILARHPSTARYIATKLARRFVSDSPPPALVERAAATFLISDGDIAEVVRTIVTSPEFFSRAAFRAKVKTPFELVVSTRRAMSVPPDTTVATVNLLATTLNQPMFGKQTPEGWPDVASAWINSGSLMKRILYSADVAEGRAPATPVSAWPGWATLAPLPREQQVDAAISMLLGGIASEATRNAMLASSASGDARAREVVAIALGSPEFQRR